MRICPACNVDNNPDAKFCGACGEQFTMIAHQNIRTGGDESLAEKIKKLNAKRRADILFVLDCTESMGGEIDAIREAITAFADSINTSGVRVRVGLVAFRDRLIGEEHRVLSFNGQVFTDDSAAFRREVEKLKAMGGGDIPESSLDALMFALQQPFSADSAKVLVLVTDAPPHIPDKDTQSLEEVTQAIRAANVQQLYLVMRTADPECKVYLRLLEGARGLAFELGHGDDFRSRAESFKHTLMSLGKTITQMTR